MTRLPRSVRGQVLLVILAALALAQGASLWLFADERDLAVRAALTREALDRAANVAELLEQAPPDMTEAVLRAATSPLVRFSVDAAPAVAHLDHAPPAMMSEIREALGHRRDMRIELHDVRGVMPPMPGMPSDMAAAHHGMAMSAVELRFSAALGDGRWLNVSTRFHRPPLQWAWTDMATFLLTAAVLLIAVWLLLGRIVRPLRLLAAAADRLGRGDWTPEIPPSGPEELARLTTAFNRMQARLRRFVDERGRILAALGHDLRSPLTALRVRAEMVDDDETREALAASIAELQDLVESTLVYARGTSSAEPMEQTDLGAFLTLLVADYAQTGREVSLSPPPAALGARIRPVAIRRALRNLIDNALRYGSAARIAIDRKGGDILVHIDDDGPGIDEADLSRVFEPFVRLEASRSRDTGGTGLGLAIARAILRAHGGEVTLENREPSGLRATIRLPGLGPEPEQAPDGSRTGPGPATQGR